MPNIIYEDRIQLETQGVDPVASSPNSVILFSKLEGEVTRLKLTNESVSGSTINTGVTQLNDLSDVNVSAPTNGQYLSRVSGQWVPTDAPFIPSNLNDFSDVNILSPTRNDMLVTHRNSSTLIARKPFPAIYMEWTGFGFQPEIGTSAPPQYYIIPFAESGNGKVTGDLDELVYITNSGAGTQRNPLSFSGASPVGGGMPTDMFWMHPAYWPDPDVTNGFEIDQAGIYEFGGYLVVDYPSNAGPQLNIILAEWSTTSNDWGDRIRIAEVHYQDEFGISSTRRYVHFYYAIVANPNSLYTLLLKPESVGVAVEMQEAYLFWKKVGHRSLVT